jgi:hypothetical protein
LAFPFSLVHEQGLALNQPGTGLTADLGSRTDRVHFGVDQCALLRMN